MNKKELKYKIKQAVEKKLYDEENLSLVSLGEDDLEVSGVYLSVEDMRKAMMELCHGEI